MSVSPDFAAMLDTIMCEASLNAMMPWDRQDAGSPIFRLHLPGFDLPVPDEEIVPDEETGTGLADAVMAGCAGMANRRRERGDYSGAAFWEEAADTGSPVAFLPSPLWG